jgi:hypothetical protein
MFCNQFGLKDRKHPIMIAIHESAPRHAFETSLHPFAIANRSTPLNGGPNENSRYEHCRQFCLIWFLFVGKFAESVAFRALFCPSFG